MKKVRVEAQNGAYNICIQNGLLKALPSHLTEYGRTLAVCDTRVRALYEEYLAPFDVIAIPEGESSKCHEQALRIYEALMQRGFGREDCLVAFGGGVVGDLVGFCAATFKRGMNFVQIPTTLLAQVDSSVGGKTGVNLPTGKNMVGAFYQPRAVLIDTAVLKTLDGRQYAGGMAEVIKYGYIASAHLHAQLANANVNTEDVIAQCCAIKARYVNEDPFDTGVRMQLNYGHTIGHAIETAAGYGTYLHGEAVAIGMRYAARMGERLGISPAGLEEDTIRLLQAHRLPCSVDSGLLRTACDILYRDKKSEHGVIHFVFIDKIGHAVLHKLTAEQIKEAALA